MRKTLMAVVAAGAMAASTSAFGQAEVKMGEEIVVNQIEGVCGVFDAAGTVVPIFAPPTGDAVLQAVMTPDGNQKITCSGTLPDGAVLPGEDGLPNNAVLWDFQSYFDTFGIERRCGTTFDTNETEDWHNVVTKSGRVTLTCHINGN